jgi:hypothetical protein
MARICPVTDGPCKAVECIPEPCGMRRPTPTLDMDRLIDRLREVLDRVEAVKGTTSVRLIVNGIAYPIVDVWFEPNQDGVGAICIGDDPR